MDIKQKVSLHNRFDIEVRDAKTSELKQRAYAENIILDQFWTDLCSDVFGYMFGRIGVGSGTGTLSAARTELFAPIVRRSVAFDSFTENKEEHYTKTVQHIKLLENEYVGQHLTEVGIVTGGAITNHLVTHALLKDMNGNIVEIIKTDVDIITIYASLYVYYSNMTAYSSMDSGHVYLTFPSGALLDNDIAKWLGGLITSPFNSSDRSAPMRFYYGNAPAGQNSGVGLAKNIDGGSTRINDIANKKVTIYYRIAADQANDGVNGIKGVGSMVVFGDGYNDTTYYAMGILFAGAAGFPEGVVIGETMSGGDGIKTRFQTVFNRLKSITRVYIDGVETSAYTVPQLVVPYSTRIDELMMLVDSNARSPGYSKMAEATPGAGLWTIVENPLYLTNPLYQVEVCYGTLDCSSDLVNWTTIIATGAAIQTVTIPAAHRGKRYWRYTLTSGASWDARGVSKWIVEAPTDYNNIQFNTAPGLVIGEAVGTGNGTEDNFMLDFTPIVGSLVVKLDGVETTAFTINESLITFTAPPANGVAVTADYRYTPTITIDYKTTCAPKDINHVLDLTFQFQFGEYTPS